MAWQVKAPTYMINGDFNISKSLSASSKLPYGLHKVRRSVDKNGVEHDPPVENYGHFKTADEAKQKYELLTKGKL